MINNKRFSRAETLQGLLELIRLPNLFTIPGDVLAGASMALITKDEMPFILPVLIISLSLYISGLILNDFFDRKLDSFERPHRPIPSGKISPSTALITAILLIFVAFALSSGLTVSVFWITLGLVLLILLYNGLARKLPFLGITVMGLCRGVNLLLGASICKNPFNHTVLTGAGAETLYIATVSTLAFHETKGPPARIKHWLPFISLLISLPILWIISKSSLFGIYISFIAMVWIFFILLKIRKNRKDLPKGIGDLIRSLILIQCAMIAVSMDRNPVYRSYYLIAIILLFIFFIVSGLTAKKFYGS